MRPVQTARAPFDDIVLVCGKCLRKAHAKHFRKALKHAFKRDGSGSAVRIVETSCLDLCPKRRIVLAGARDLARGRVMIAEPDDPDGAASRLLARRGKDRERDSKAVFTAGLVRD